MANPINKINIVVAVSVSVSISVFLFFFLWGSGFVLGDLNITSGNQWPTLSAEFTVEYILSINLLNYALYVPHVNKMYFL